MLDALLDKTVGCPRKRIRDATALPILDKTWDHFLFPKAVRAEPAVFEAIFQLGVFSLNPRPLYALTSDRVIVLLSSSDESSPSEEYYSADTLETSTTMRALAYLEKNRKHRSSKASDVEVSHAYAQEEPVQNKKGASGPKKVRLADCVKELMQAYARKLSKCNTSYVFVFSILALVFIICRND